MDVLVSDNQNLFLRAKTVMPGGVNSPVRAFKNVGGDPIFFQQGKGAYLIDIAGKHYIDYVGSWGSLIIGHGHQELITTLCNTVNNGISFGTPSVSEVILAEKIISLMPSIEQIRMVNSGTEATMTAIRLARAFTHKQKIIKFNGCYHGHHDSLLVKAGSGLLTLGIPASSGVLPSVTEHTLVAEFNDIASVEALFAQYPNDIATIIVEPVAGNMNLILPSADFLCSLRQLCDKYNTVLIFDEVMTGFRVALGGAQALYNCRPDLTTLGKIIGGGLPIGALGGRKEIMQHLAPAGDVYQAGTLAGNPLAMNAGITILDILQRPGFYENLTQNTTKLISGLQKKAAFFGISLQVKSCGAMFGFLFSKQDNINNYQDVASGNILLFKKFFHAMIAQGVYFAPSMFEAGFVSSAHTDEEIELTIAAAEVAFANF